MTPNTVFKDLFPNYFNSRHIKQKLCWLLENLEMYTESEIQCPQKTLQNSVQRSC